MRLAKIEASVLYLLSSKVLGRRRQDTKNSGVCCASWYLPITFMRPRDNRKMSVSVVDLNLTFIIEKTCTYSRQYLLILSFLRSLCLSPNLKKIFKCVA